MNKMLKQIVFKNLCITSFFFCFFFYFLQYLYFLFIIIIDLVLYAKLYKKMEVHKVRMTHKLNMKYKGSNSSAPRSEFHTRFYTDAGLSNMETKFFDDYKVCQYIDLV